MPLADSSFVDFLSSAFVQSALAVGVLVAVLLAYLGVIVVQRGLSFVSVGLSHSAFGGVALGLLIGTEPLLTAIPFVIGIALAMVVLGRRQEIKPDTSVGVLFTLAMALGIVFLSLKDSFSADAFGYLFGSLYAIEWIDSIYAGGVLLFCLLLFRFWGRWAYASYDRELARADSVAIARDDTIFMLLLALAVVSAVKLVGMVLLAALLVIPAATARQMTQTLRGMTIAAMILSSGTMLLGIWGSYHLNLPSGATVVLLQAGIFVLFSLVGRRSR